MIKNLFLGLIGIVCLGLFYQGVSPVTQHYLDLGFLATVGVWLTSTYLTKALTEECEWKEEDICDLPVKNIDTKVKVRTKGPLRSRVKRS